MEALYTADNKYICQVINWPPRNTEQGWELDVLCDPVLLREFQEKMRYATFRVDSIAFEGLERILPVVVPRDEQAQVTLVFQYCASIEKETWEPYALGVYEIPYRAFKSVEIGTEEVSVSEEYQQLREKQEKELQQCVDEEWERYQQRKKEVQDAVKRAQEDYRRKRDEHSGDC